MGPGKMMADFPAPVFTSNTIEYLHWDVFMPCVAYELLATSLRAGAFPALEELRCPNDHNGVLQAVCRPIEKIPAVSTTTGRRPSVSRTVSAARREAQERIESARKHDAFKIVVQNEAGVKDVFATKKFMGRLGSGIAYNLEADVKGSENALVQMEYLLGRRGGPGIDVLVARPLCFGGEGSSEHRGRAKSLTLDSATFFGVR